MSGAVRRQKARGVVDVPVVHQQQRVQSCTGNGLYSHRVCHFKSLQCYSSSVYADRMISPSSIERPSPLAEQVEAHALHALQRAEAERSAALGHRLFQSR